MTRPSSYAPLALAGGIMLIFWGVASTWILSLTGLAVAVFGAARWIKDAKSE
jgi:hypothetical protein